MTGKVVGTGPATRTECQETRAVLVVDTTNGLESHITVVVHHQQSLWRAYRSSLSL